LYPAFFCLWRDTRETATLTAVAGEDKELGAEVFKVVGPRIAKRREAIGLSQEQLADQVSLHRTAISPLELGKRGTRLVTFSASRLPYT
jgi:ribosome-binding protein aMBF1 (putative translation factor)